MANGDNFNDIPRDGGDQSGGKFTAGDLGINLAEATRPADTGDLKLSQVTFESSDKVPTSIWKPDEGLKSQAAKVGPFNTNLHTSVA